MRYAKGFHIKVSGSRQYEGEYAGGATLAAAVKRAREEFVPHVGAHDSVRIVRFSQDGLRVYTVKVVKESSGSGYGNRRRRGRRYGSMPARPRLASTSYIRGREVRVFETGRGYYVEVPGVAGVPGPFETIREANARGRSIIEAGAESRSAAYARRNSRGRFTRRRR